MEKNNIDMYMMANGDKLPSEKVFIIEEALRKLPDDKMMLLQSFQYKDPVVLLIISLFFGSLGIDRFILGQTGLGILKLLTCGGLGVWSIIDWFLVMGKTREWNFHKFLMMADPSNPLCYSK